jgi:hypothetical protein
MENNAILNIRLVELLNILDARAIITLFTEIGAEPVKRNVKVYELLADSDFIKTHKNTEVKGLVSFYNVTNILIKEA